MQREYLAVYPAEIATFTETRWATNGWVQGYGEHYGSLFLSRKYQWLWLDR